MFRKKILGSKTLLGKIVSVTLLKICELYCGIDFVILMHLGQIRGVVGSEKRCLVG